MEISNFLNNVSGSATAQIFAKAKDLEAQGRDIVHLEIGQPDFKPPEPILKATSDAILQGKTSYTVSKGTYDLLNAISAYHEDLTGKAVNPDHEIVVTTGAKLAIFASLWSVVNPGDNVIVLNPGWVSYGDIVNSIGGEARYVPVDLEFNFDQNQLIDMVDDKTKACIINSPSNPTGSIISRANLSLLYEICSSNDILLVSDEIYHEYIYDGQHISLMELENWKDYGVVVNGFSKTFSMTGFRIGYVLTNKQIASEVNKVMQLTASCPVNFAQIGAISALENIDLMRTKIKSIMFERRDLITKLLGELPVEFLAPKGAIYAWVNIPGVDDSVEWSRRLLEEEGVAVTPGRAFGPDGEGFIRICFATDNELIRKGIQRISSFIS